MSAPFLAVVSGSTVMFSETLWYKARLCLSSLFALTATANPGGVLRQRLVRSILVLEGCVSVV